jgi:hypothetical protein
VQVSRNVVYAAAAAFLALFAVVFFLLGRESNRRRAPAAVSVTAPSEMSTSEARAVAAVPPPAVIPALPAVAPVPRTRGAPDAETRVGFAPRAGASEPTISPVIVAAPLPPLEPSRAAAGDAAAAARDYFTRMGAIQTFASTNDTGEFANKLLLGTMNGDMSGFDDLLHVMQLGTERARAITPPACCVEYHQRLLGMLADSTQLLDRLKTAIKGGDTGALTALTASASSLQSRADALDSEARRIKTRLGLAQ